jgi:hypothetical protein
VTGNLREPDGHSLNAAVISGLLLTQFQETGIVSLRGYSLAQLLVLAETLGIDSTEVLVTGVVKVRRAD